MKRLAVYFTAPRQVSVREEPVPSPSAGEVLVEAMVSAISSGTELLVYRGLAPNDVPLDATISELASQRGFPLNYGYSIVGRVVEAGLGVAREWVGRRVFAFHPHESHFVKPVAEVVAIPEGLTVEDAALLPSMETAVNFLMDGQPVVGERVVLFGQGVVGLLTTALLAPLPLDSVITLDRFARRRERSLALGARASIDPQSPDAVALLESLLQEAGSFAGADLTYELSGDPAALDTAIAVTGFGGRVVIGSWYGQKRVDLNLGGRFHRNRTRLISSQVSTIAPEWTGRWSRARRLRTAVRMLERVRPASLVTHRIPVERASEAYALLDAWPEEALQMILTYETES